VVLGKIFDGHGASLHMAPVSFERVLAYTRHASPYVRRYGYRGLWNFANGFEVIPDVVTLDLASGYARNKEQIASIRQKRIEMGLQGVVAAMVPSMMDGLRDVDPKIQMAALDAVFEIGPELDAVVPMCLGLLNAPNEGVQVAAARALYALELRPGDGVSVLCRLLTSGDRGIRMEALDCLQFMGGDAAGALDALEAFMESEDNDSELKQVAASVRRAIVAGRGATK
jgi:hypothetical protein